MFFLACVGEGLKSEQVIVLLEPHNDIWTPPHDDILSETEGGVHQPHDDIESQLSWPHDVFFFVCGAGGGTPRAGFCSSTKTNKLKTKMEVKHSITDENKDEGQAFH